MSLLGFGIGFSDTVFYPIEKLPSPKTLLRIGSIFCLVSAAALAIAGPKIFGYGTLPGEHLRALSVLLFTLFFPFTLLHIEYELAQKITRSELNERIGYIQSFGCLFLLIYGMVATFSSSGFGDTMLLLQVCIFGEVTFLINVIWSYLEPGSALPIRRPTLHGTQGKWRWSRSPSQLFGVGAALFAALGFVFLFAQGSQVPFPRAGKVVLLPTLLLGLMASALFATFALLYWLMELKGKRFHELTSRIHFMFTLALVLDALRVYMAWSRTAAYKYASPVIASDFRATLIFAIATVATFLWNILRNYNAHL